MKSRYILASRPSQLAITQAEAVIAYFKPHFPDSHFSIEAYKTTGDRQEDWSLEEKGGQGLFTKELENALLEKEADWAIHSAKDMPTVQPEGLIIAGYLPREDVRDVYIVRKNVAQAAFIATGSPRRRAQATLIYPDAQWIDIRGNVQTRLRKVFDGYAHATYLAAAGLNRLDIDKYAGLTFEFIPIRQMVPAAGQGAIAVQCREGEEGAIRTLLDLSTHTAVTIERAVLNYLGVGCQTPVGVHFDGSVLHFYHPSSGYKAMPFTPPNDENSLEEEVEKVLKNFSIKKNNI